jgi:REP element-mobilizing transposase RayT
VPREPRIEVPGGYYHVVTRGNNKHAIFDEVLRMLFLEQLARIASRYGWRVLVYVMMTNHFHLVFRLAEGGLSDGMRDLNTVFARASNARFGRINHCFGERFWSAHLETDRHLLSSIRYAMWNPPRAGIGAHPVESNWTSFRATVGLDWSPEALALPDLLELFGSNPTRAQPAFRRFVSEGRERCQAPWDDGRGILT